MGDLERVCKAPTSHPNDHPETITTTLIIIIIQQGCQGPSGPVTLHPARASTQTCGGLVSSHITSARASTTTPRHHLTVLLRKPSQQEPAPAKHTRARISPFCRRVELLNSANEGQRSIANHQTTHQAPNFPIPTTIPKPSQHHSARIARARHDTPPSTCFRPQTLCRYRMISHHSSSTRVSTTTPPHDALARNLPNRRARSCKSTQGPASHPFCCRRVELLTSANEGAMDTHVGSRERKHIESASAAVILPAARGHTIHGMT